MRGTTTNIYFALQAPIEQHEEIWFTGVQGRKIIIDKTIKDVQWDEAKEKAYVHLTQEETLKIQETMLVQFQVRAKFLDGNVYKTKVWAVNPTVLLKDGVI